MIATCKRTFVSHKLLLASFLHCSYLHNDVSQPQQLQMQHCRPPLQQLSLAL